MDRVGLNSCWRLALLYLLVGFGPPSAPWMDGLLYFLDVSVCISACWMDAAQALPTACWLGVAVAPLLSSKLVVKGFLPY